MAHPVTTLLSGEFDRFLFEPIGKDSNGLPLTVASALARMDLDAWQEAATLAALPAETAVRKLTDLFGASPDQTLMEPNRAKLVTRLIALLPAPKRSNASSQSISGSADTFIHSRAHTRAVLFTLYLLALLSLPFVFSLRNSPTLGGPAMESTSRADAARPPDSDQ